LRGTIPHQVKIANPIKSPKKRVFFSGLKTKFTTPNRKLTNNPIAKNLKRGCVSGKKPVLASMITKRL